MSYQIARDEIGVAHIVALSGGKDSCALALALKEKHPRPYTYVYAPTGDELPEMEEHMQKMEQLLGQPVLRLTNGTLASQIETNNMLPNCFARWCTRILKLKPAQAFYEQAAPVICYVGLRDDEDEREGLSTSNPFILQSFPFQEWGWGLEDVWALLNSKGVSIPERTDCARCPYQKLGEWYNLWERHPDLYESAVQDEQKYGHTYRSPGRDTWPASLAELREKFEAGQRPERSLRMMEKRNGMCRACSL